MIINIANFNFDGVSGSGGGSGISGIDFSSIGYDAELSAEVNASINDDVAYSKTLLDAWNPSNTSAYRLYSNDTKLVYAPNIVTSNVNRMDSMFQGCSNLKTVPELDTSNVSNMSNMFSACNNLISVPELDTSNVTNMNGMLNNCQSITSVPAFNTSNVTNMSYMLYFCTSLTSVPAFNTSKVTNMSYMLRGCSRLTSVPTFDTSKVTTMEYMFAQCSGLTSVPELDTSNVNDMDGMFQYCPMLKKIEGISVKSMKVIPYYVFFDYSQNSSVRKFLIKDIGTNTAMTQFNMSFALNWGVNSDDVTDARQSLIDSLITYSFDRATAGYSTCTITLSANTKALLTSDEIAQITAKGYTIA
jgi:surface protein